MLTILLFVQLFVYITCSSKLPSSFALCKKSDPEFGNCFAKGIKHAFSIFADGYGPLKIPALYPIKIPKITVAKGSGPVGVDQNLDNVALFAFGDDVEVQNASVNFNTFEFEIKFFHPVLSIIAHYEMNGHILTLPIVGDGDSNITLFRTQTKHNFKGEKFVKKDKTYLKIIDYKVKFTPEGAYYHFDKLFGGNEQLGNELNAVMNENWKELFYDVVDGHEQVYAIVFQDIVKKIFEHVPFDELYPN